MKWKRGRSPKRFTKQEQELIELAALPVPRGSGVQSYGVGRYQYLKMNNHDGSARVFCFHNRAAMREAMANGVAADALVEAGGQRASA